MNYADAISSTQTAIGIAATVTGNPVVGALSNFLLGQASFVGQMADLGMKVQNGTAKPEDYAEVIQAGAQILAGLGVLTGTVGPAYLAALTAVGVGLFVYKNIDNIEAAIDSMQLKPYVWKNDLPPDFASQIQSEVDGLIDIPKIIDPTTNSCFVTAQNWVAPRDPLVLDLDGGGIATSAIDPNAPIYFDQNGDGIRTATGWIGAGEALVVRDLNGNGLIDSGRELFGDSTVLTHGATAGQTAANGFAALADLDRDANGVADGKFDSQDVAFDSVRLWRDTNQDGISQAGELHTFAELGVASINVTGAADRIDLGGGNTQALSGSFTRTNGETGGSGTADLAGSLLLANNNFFRQFTDNPALTEAAQALPQMQGSGWVRDLREAMSLGTAQALGLQGKVAQFAEMNCYVFGSCFCLLTKRDGVFLQKNLGVNSHRFSSANETNFLRLA